MSTFEYHMWPSRVGASKSDDNQMMAHMNSLGALGWKLIAVVAVGAWNHHYFVRKVEENRVMITEDNNKWAGEGTTKQ